MFTSCMFVLRAQTWISRIFKTLHPTTLWDTRAAGYRKATEAPLYSHAVGASGENRKYNWTIKMTKHPLFIPKCPWASMLRVGGGVMWGLCLVISTAGAAAGHASVPPRIFCCCSCQSDQITQKPQSDLKQSKINVRAWSAVLLVGPKTLNRRQREEQAVLQQTSSVLTPQRHFVRVRRQVVRAADGCSHPPAWKQRLAPSPAPPLSYLSWNLHYIVNSSVNI